MVRCPSCGFWIERAIGPEGFIVCPACRGIVTKSMLEKGLSFASKVSFKFKGESILGDLVGAFRDYFEKENEGHWSEIEEGTLLSGKLVALEASRLWFLGDVGVALILFYSEDNHSGEAAAYVYSSRYGRSSDSRAKNKLTEQVRVFFSGKCDQIIQVDYQSPQKYQQEAQKEEQTTEPQPQGWLAPIRFCQTCGAAIAIDESAYCWNCGSRLPAREKEASQYGGEETSKTQPTSNEVEHERNCMICKLPFKEGNLLAWCPHCGAPAHRVHMLEWLHVKGTCPACGQQLATPELEEQLSKAHLQQPSQAQPHTRTEK